jgi:uncharacterized protein
VRILLDRLTETPTSLRFTASPQWFAGAIGETARGDEGLAGDLVVELEARKMGEDVLLEGVVTGELELACGRCLSRYRAPLREPFRLVLEPAGERVPADPEGAAALAADGLALADELEVGWYRGSEIELGRFVVELVALALPVQPLCREGCRGLCPRCGADRNTERCECPEERPPSPFAGLAALRDAKK